MRLLVYKSLKWTGRPPVATFFARRFRKTSPHKTCAFWTVTPSPFCRYDKQNKFHVFAKTSDSMQTHKKLKNSRLRFPFSYVNINWKGTNFLWVGRKQLGEKRE